MRIIYQRFADELAQHFAALGEVIEAHILAQMSMLLEHVYAVGNLMGKLKLVERSLSHPDAADRRALAECLNGINGEMAFCRDLADRRDLAKRVNLALGFPLIDGLTMRGLTYILGENSGLLHDMRALVQQTGRAAPLSPSNIEARR